MEGQQKLVAGFEVSGDMGRTIDFKNIKKDQKQVEGI